MFRNSVIAFIGGGTMTNCLIRGLQRKQFPLNQIIVTNKSPEKLTQLVKDWGVRSAKTNAEAIALADAVVLSVKPHVVKEVCLEVAGIVKNKKPLIISLAAATRLEDISNWLSVLDLAIVRTMTNMATSVGQGTTALCANSHVTESRKELTQMLFNAVGNAFWVNQESDLNQYSPLIGCAPAFLCLFIEAMQKAAIVSGIPVEMATKIALEAVCGAAELVKQSDCSVEELRRKVTTPKGVTESAIKPMIAGNYLGLFGQAFKEGVNRCNEIEESLHSSHRAGK